MEIRWSEAALTRIEEIGAFIATDSPSRADAFVLRLVQAAKRLSRFPYSGAVVPENPAFRQVVFAGYRLIYRILERKVEIVTVIPPGLLF